MKEYLLFDLDGTLTDPKVGITTCVQYALKAFDINALLSQCAVLVPFGIGVIIGIFGVAKLINYLFHRHGVSTYCGIFGLILASPFAIIYQSEAYKNVSIGFLVIGIILMVACAIAAYFMGKITAE